MLREIFNSKHVLLINDQEIIVQLLFNFRSVIPANSAFSTVDSGAYGAKGLEGILTFSFSKVFAKSFQRSIYSVGAKNCRTA